MFIWSPYSSWSFVSKNGFSFFSIHISTENVLCLEFFCQNFPIRTVKIVVLFLLLSNRNVRPAWYSSCLNDLGTCIFPLLHLMLMIFILWPENSEVSPEYKYVVLFINVCVWVLTTIFRIWYFFSSEKFSYMINNCFCICSDYFRSHKYLFYLGFLLGLHIHYSLPFLFLCSPFWFSFLSLFFTALIWLSRVLLFFSVVLM